MSKSKKTTVGVLGGVVGVILIVLMVFLSVIYSKDLSNDFTFDNKSYNEGYDASTKSVNINVASYNVKSGYNTKDNLIAIRNQLKAYDVDIAGLQEIDADDMARSKSVKCVSTLASDIYTSHFFAGTNSLYLGDKYGIMTMSRYDLIESDRLFLPIKSKMFMLRGEPRVVVRTIVNIDGVDVAFYNAHLSFENNVKMNGGNEMRCEQIKFIYDTMQQDPCEYKVLVGDMNIMSFDELDIFKDGYKMVNNQDITYDTYRGDDVTLHALDNIIYSDNMTLLRSEMIDNDLSDHNMLYATLKIG